MLRLLPTLELPTVHTESAERADAARNRRRILAAAARLFDANGVRGTSMDAIATAAGVGKGTLFRRFGDRAALARALLDDTERAFQDALLSGSPPVGPGAPPCQRLRAYGTAMLDRLERDTELMLEAELASAGTYLEAPPVRAHWLHVHNLVLQARPICDPDYAADMLIGALSPQLFVHQRHGRDMDLDRLKAGYADLVDRLMTAPPT
jgi:AcrR family transcriptional regulator